MVNNILKVRKFILLLDLRFMDRRMGFVTSVIFLTSAAIYSYPVMCHIMVNDWKSGIVINLCNCYTKEMLTYIMLSTLKREKA